jgi:hypothetical protein
MEDTYSFGTTLMVPVGTNILMYQTIKVNCFSPSLLHYRVFKVLTETIKVRLLLIAIPKERIIQVMHQLTAEI